MFPVVSASPTGTGGVCRLITVEFEAISRISWVSEPFLGTVMLIFLLIFHWSSTGTLALDWSSTGALALDWSSTGALALDWFSNGALTFDWSGTDALGFHWFSTDID